MDLVMDMVLMVMRDPGYQLIMKISDKCMGFLTDVLVMMANNSNASYWLTLTDID